MAVEALHRFPDSFLWGACAQRFPCGASLSLHPWSELEECSRDYDPGKTELGDSIVSTGWTSNLGALCVPINWGWLEPEPGTWNHTASDYYLELFTTLRQNGLTPFVTLMQGHVPGWFSDAGGWMQPEGEQQYLDYVSRAVEAFGYFAHDWIPLNTPLHYAMLSTLKGQLTPRLQDNGSFERLLSTLMIAQHGASERIHRMQPESSVGMTLWYWPAVEGSGMKDVPDHNHLLEFYRTGRLRMSGVSVTADPLLKTCDFIGIQFPTLGVLAESGWIVPGEIPGIRERSRDFYEDLAGVNQKNLLSAMKWGRAFKIPIFLTRHTIFNQDADLRKLMVFSTIRSLWRPVNESWPVRGYFYHDLADLCRAIDDPGLTAADCERVPARSVSRARETGRVLHTVGDLYQEICRQGAVSSSMGREFAPELYEYFFPGAGARDISMILEDPGL